MAPHVGSASTECMTRQHEHDAAVDLHWIPLGAGAHVVRLSGRLYEALAALVQRRPRRDLFHAALEITVPEGRFVIEMVPGLDVDRAGVGAAEGPVGMRWLGRFRLFRYVVRCERDGVIPDVHEAIESPVLVSGDPEVARRLMRVLPELPSLTWGRDEAGTGDMWSCNSIVSWALTRANVDIADMRPPSGGRAPGWDAGRTVAASQLQVDVGATPAVATR